MEEIERIDMSGVLHFIDEIRTLLAAMDGTPLDNPDGETSRARRSWNAKRGRELLYAAHLADCVRLDINSQYYRFKGFDLPQVLLHEAFPMSTDSGTDHEIGLTPVL